MLMAFCLFHYKFDFWFINELKKFDKLVLWKLLYIIHINLEVSDTLTIDNRFFKGAFHL